MKIIYVGGALRPLRWLSRSRGPKGCTNVYHWHGTKHHRNAGSLARLPNSVFSLTDFKPLCKWWCCLRRAFLSGLQFYRSWYFNTLLLENFPFLILPFFGFSFEVGEHGTGRRLHIRLVSLLRFVPVRECECASELVNCLVGCGECGVPLAGILDSDAEHFALKSSSYTRMISVHLAVTCVWSFGDHGVLDLRLVLSDLLWPCNPASTPGFSYIGSPSTPHTSIAIPIFVSSPTPHPRTGMFTPVFTTGLILCDVMWRNLLASRT